MALVASTCNSLAARQIAFFALHHFEENLINYIMHLDSSESKFNKSPNSSSPFEANLNLG